MGRKPKGDRVLSVRYHKNTGKFRVRYVQSGKERSEFYQSEMDAHRRAAGLRDQMAGAELAGQSGKEPPRASSGPDTTQAGGQVKLGQGTLGDWKHLTWFCAIQVIRNPDNRSWQDVARTIATLAESGRKLHSTISKEEEETAQDDDLSTMSQEELEAEVGRLMGTSGDGGSQ